MTRTRLLRSLVLATAVVAAASSLGGPVQAGSSHHLARFGALHQLGPASGGWDALAVTTQGVAVAVWAEAPAAPHAGQVIVTSVRRPGHSWTSPRTLGRVGGHTDTISAVRLASGGVAAGWISFGHKIVTRVWHPRGGWGRPHALTGSLRYFPAPALASDVVAHTWATAFVVRGSAPHQFDVEAVVHSHGHTTTTVIGPSGCRLYAPRLVTDDSGDLVATWSGGDDCLSGGSAEASLLPSGTTTWTSQTIPACDSPPCARLPQLVPFLDAGRFALVEQSYSQQGAEVGRASTLWHADDDGVWTAEPGDYHRFIGRDIADITSDRVGDILTCSPGPKERIDVRPAGGAWQRVDLPGSVAEACAIDNHRHVAVIGSRIGPHHHVVLTWGRIGQTRYDQERSFDSGSAYAARVVVRGSGVLTALVPQGHWLFGLRGLLGASDRTNDPMSASDPS
jgi:hypothetical protein